MERQGVWYACEWQKFRLLCYFWAISSLWQNYIVYRMCLNNTTKAVCWWKSNIRLRTCYYLLVKSRNHYQITQWCITYRLIRRSCCVIDRRHIVNRWCCGGVKQILVLLFFSLNIIFQNCSLLVSTNIL